MLHRNSFTADTNPRNVGTCGLFDIAGQLGQAHRSTRYVVALVAQLIAHKDFPPPLPALRAGVRTDSRWTRDVVDAWFAELIPASAAPAVAAAEQARTAAALAARAERLAS